MSPRVSDSKILHLITIIHLERRRKNYGTVRQVNLSMGRASITPGSLIKIIFQIVVIISDKINQAIEIIIILISIKIFINEMISLIN